MTAKTEPTRSQLDMLMALAVDVGESHFPYGMDAVLVYANRHQPNNPVPYEIRSNGQVAAVGAGYGWSGVRYPQGCANIHEEIGAVIRAAERIAPRTAESALDSGNTDTKPTSPIRAKAWDMVAYAHVLNAISDVPAAVRSWGFEA